MATELATTRRRWRIGSNRWKGRVVRYCFNTEAASLEASLWDSPFPGMSGPNAAVCIDVEVQESFRPNRSRVISLYESPRKAGEARATVRTVAVPVDMVVRATEELGEAWQSTGKAVVQKKRAEYRWRAVSKAEEIEHRALLAITLETAYPADTFDMNRIVQLHRHVNAEPVPALMAIESRQLLFDDARSVHSFNPAELVYFDLDFILDPKGWKRVDFEIWWKGLKEKTVQDDKGADTTQKVAVADDGALLVNKERIVRSITKYEEGDLTSLVGEGLIEW